MRTPDPPVVALHDCNRAELADLGGIRSRGVPLEAANEQQITQLVNHHHRALQAEEGHGGGWVFQG
jgi:hypothetical protein